MPLVVSSQVLLHIECHDGWQMPWTSISRWEGEKVEALKFHGVSYSHLKFLTDFAVFLHVESRFVCQKAI